MRIYTYVHTIGIVYVYHLYRLYIYDEAGRRNPAEFISSIIVVSGLTSLKCTFAGRYGGDTSLITPIIVVLFCCCGIICFNETVEMIHLY